MAKKAKRTTRPSRPPSKLRTAEATIAVLQNDLHVARSNNAGLREDLAKSEKLVEQHIERAARSGDEILRRGRSINRLKEIVAKQEADIARHEGTIAALKQQIDQAAPKVELRPAVMVSPAEYRKAMNGPRGGDFRLQDLERSPAGSEPHEQHWTAL